MNIGNFIKGILGVPFVLVGFIMLTIGFVGAISTSILSSIFAGLMYSTNVFLLFAFVGFSIWILGIYMYFKYSNALANLAFGVVGIFITLLSIVITILGLLSIPVGLSGAGVGVLISSAVIFFGLVGVVLGLSFVQFGLGLVIYKPLGYVTKLFIGFTKAIRG